MRKKKNGEYTPEQVAQILADFKKGLDRVEAEREYRDMLENGGVDADELLAELKRIHEHAKRAS